ncbi:glutamate--tRNA ligase [bacterium]|nr:glutamate--tRNA ligase [bacterium]
MTPVRVRFAPSPTGFLHIGGVRTAIFNYLFARHHDGQFLIRIEDTDTQRSKQEYEDDILDALKWLGLKWDEEPLRQSTRVTRHREMVEELIERGAAFRCFVPMEKAQAMKEAEMARGGINAFRSPDRELTPKESKARADAGEPYAIRFKVPTLDVAFKDHVRGTVTTPAHTIDDFIILRKDGTPTYMMAVVVDDSEMEITMVIRGADHITNTPKQVLLYQALGLPVPEFAHVPLILGPDKKRLSKRHGAAAVTEYRGKGYLPEAIMSYMATLGWSAGEDKDVYTREELIEQFDLKGINKASAVFDEQKLEWMNAQFMSQVRDCDLQQMLRPEFARRIEAGQYPHGTGPMLAEAVRLLKTRAHFPVDILDKGGYFFEDPTELEDRKAAKKRLKHEDLPARLDEMAGRFEALQTFDEEQAEEALRVYTEELEENAGALIHPVRLAVSGMGSGPSLFELLVSLGQETVVRRIRTLAAHLRKHGTPPVPDDPEQPLPKIEPLG